MGTSTIYLRPKPETIRKVDSKVDSTKCRHLAKCRLLVKWKLETTGHTVDFWGYNVDFWYSGFGNVDSFTKVDSISRADPGWLFDQESTLRTLVQTLTIMSRKCQMWCRHLGLRFRPMDKHYKPTQETKPDIRSKFYEVLTSFGWDIEVFTSNTFGETKTDRRYSNLI